MDPAGGDIGFAAPAASGLTRARAEAFHHAQRHSRRVRWLKFLVPAAATVMAASFIGYSVMSTPAPATPGSQASAVADGRLVMANPKLEGVTKGGRPYLMTADRAIQSFDNESIIDLEGIDAKMPVEGDNWARIVAKTGVYDRKANTLQLQTDVNITTTDGMVGKLDSVFVDIGTGAMKSADPVDIEQRGSRITADSMQILDDGKRLVFEKRVRMNIVPEAEGPASGGTNASN
jgi:lipopolysaccharide export system protein LptC